MSDSLSPPTPTSKHQSDTFERELNRELMRWRIATVSYGSTYYFTRIILIVASAIVAANENLSHGKGSSLIPWIPLLALVVAIVTALDTWLKPQQKWRGFMESRDILVDLVIQIENGLPIDEARTKFYEIRARHRDRNVF
jgi:Protein of unknown function (DUF4231)